MAFTDFMDVNPVTIPYSEVGNLIQKLNTLAQKEGNDFKVNLSANGLNFLRWNTLLNQFEFYMNNTLIGSVSTERGFYARANLKMATKPTAGDTVTIGSDVYEFGGVGANINVAIGAAVANSRTNLAAAINTLGTKSILAEVSTVPTAGVSIIAAATKGGTPVKGPGPTLALSEVLTAIADVWDQANLNVLGASEGIAKRATGKITLDATNAASAFAVKLDFNAAKVEWEAYDSTGAEKDTTATVITSGAYIVVDPTAGITPLVSTDFVLFEATL